jgi:hypothetical protein
MSNQTKKTKRNMIYICADNDNTTPIPAVYWMPTSPVMGKNTKTIELTFDTDGNFISRKED